MKNKDSITTGVVVGLILPLLVMSGIILFSSSKFDSIQATIEHFQRYKLLYQILSISLMPSAGLFFIWSKKRINQARGVLLMTLFYGAFVIMLYLS